MRLYVHWPFCLSRCPYCDFVSRVADRRLMSEYRRALLKELDLRAGAGVSGGAGLRSLYMGGGTPSTLSGNEVAALLRCIGERFRLGEGAEVSVEVNPATWTAADFAAAAAGGVNRFSIGVQSLQDRFLKALGRAHGAREALAAMRAAHRCASGGAVFSLDLLYGLPGMDTRALLATLGEALEAGPHHLSLYALTPAPGTSMSRALARGEMALPHEDEVAEQYLAACETLQAAGYEHYEISNFCRPGYRCRHNCAYWEREEYLGVGAGAHSFMAARRMRNTPSLLAYIKAVRAGRLPVEGCETLNAEEGRAEEIMLGLRTRGGVSARLLDADPGRLDQLADLGLLKQGEGCVSLTARGMLLSNALISEFLPA